MGDKFTELEARALVGRRVRSKGGVHRARQGKEGTIVDAQETFPGNWTVVVDWDLPCEIVRTWFLAEDYKNSVVETEL